MSAAQCPICFTPLEIRTVTPCFVCGANDEHPLMAKYQAFRLPNEELIVLCKGCQLEEFMVPGGWGFQMFPEEQFPLDALSPIPEQVALEPSTDKYCPSCKLPYKFLRILAVCGISS